jgi:hypothetical protein
MLKLKNAKIHEAALTLRQSACPDCLTPWRKALGPPPREALPYVNITMAE